MNMPCLFSFVTASLAGALLACAIARNVEPNQDGASSAPGCQALRIAFPTKVFFPGSQIYDYEAQAFWSNTQLLSPGCVFRPSCALDVSAAVLASRATQTEFAVRGGGHMGVTGANNIDGGVLMVMSHMTDIKLSEDQDTLTLGPGFRWGEVYSFLEPYDLAVSGGRLSPVGVPGLLLAGGIGFHGNQYGWSADSVLEYEVVLAEGSVVKATKEVNSDLFWALKGGSSNFGIVTSFTLRTFKTMQVWAGVYTVAGDYLSEFLAALASYSAFNADPLSHIVPMVIPRGPSMIFASVILFYDSPTISNPACFDGFLAIPPIVSTLGFKTLSEFSLETGGLVMDHINDMFIAGSTVGKDYDSLLKGVRIVNDVFLASLPDLYAAVPPQKLRLVNINWQPIGTLWQAGSKTVNPMGNPLGVDPAKKGTYLAWAEAVEWIGSEYDDAVESWVVNTTNAINEATNEAGVYDAFKYMGDAAGFQEIYSGYGDVNRQKLLEISRKYDPERVFQTLLPGGFKIGT